MTAFRVGIITAIITLAFSGTLIWSLAKAGVYRDAEMQGGNAGPLLLVHGEYAWINEHGYKGTDGLHCCGWSDCMEVPATSVNPTPDGYGYSTPKGIIGNKGVYHSRDGKAWICRYQGGPPKCLFVPGGG